MIKSILFILSGLGIGILFVFIKNKVINKTKEVIGEKFDTPKFVSGLTNVTSSVSWAKTISTLFNARVLIIIGIIVGVIYGYGYWKGKSGQQPILNWRGKEETVALNEHYLHIKKDGTMEVLDKDKKTVLKKITVNDLDILKKNLRPYGFILDPVAVGGFGISNASTGFEGGVGVRYFKYFNWVGDICITNGGFYPIGLSYRLTENTAIGASVGTGYKEGERGFFEKWLAKVTIKF